MKSLSVSDGGHKHQLLLREDVDLPALPTPEEPAHMQYLAWWKKECGKMGLTYEYRIAEPQGIRIIQSLLKKNTIAELKELGRHFLLDHGDKLRTNPNHFAIFSSLLGSMKQELKRE